MPFSSEFKISINTVQLEDHLLNTDTNIYARLQVIPNKRQQDIPNLEYTCVYFRQSDVMKHNHISELS